jgi:hypothetical protein
VRDALEVYLSASVGDERAGGGAGDGVTPDDAHPDGPAVTGGDGAAGGGEADAGPGVYVGCGEAAVGEQFDDEIADVVVVFAARHEWVLVRRVSWVDDISGGEGCPAGSRA